MGNNDFSWVGALGGINLFLFAWSVSGATEFLAREQGVLEIAQLVLILIAALLFLGTAMRTRGPARTAAIALVGLAICCFYRELDLAALGAPGWLAVMSTSSVRDVTLGVLVALLLFYVFSCRQDIPVWLNYAKRPEAWPLLGSGILLGIGIALNAALKGDLQAQFWEELVEFNGYVLFVLAALRHRRLARQDEVIDRPVTSY